MFQNAYSVVLGLSAHYELAVEVSEAFLATAQRYRLDFAVPYALTTTAIGYAGLRRWQDAESALLEALRRFRASKNPHGQQSAYALYLRVLGQQGRQEAALGISLPPLRGALPVPRAEVLSSRALMLATSGRIDEALDLLTDVRGSTQAVEPVVLVSAVDAVAALKRRAPQAVERVLELEQTAFSTGAVDLLVCAYRSAPELLAILLSASPDRDRLIELLGLCS